MTVKHPGTIGRGAFVHFTAFTFASGSSKSKFAVVLENPVQALESLVVVLTTSLIAKYGLTPGTVPVRDGLLPGLPGPTVIDCNNLHLVKYDELCSVGVSHLGQVPDEVMSKITKALAEATSAPEALVARALIAARRR